MKIELTKLLSTMHCICSSRVIRPQPAMKLTGAVFPNYNPGQ